MVPFPRAAYYARIGATASLLPQLTPTLATRPPRERLRFLRDLMLAHTTVIPFESIDALLGRPVSLAPADIFDKLIHARRGGYCFEQNALFHHAMLDAGFDDVRRLAARVTWGSVHTPMGRSHMLNLVTLPSDGGDAAAPPQQWLVDVGFGVGVPRAPLLLSTDAPQRTPAGTVRVVPRNAAGAGLSGVWTEYAMELQVAAAPGWREVYHFDLQPQLPRDFHMMNYVIQRQSIFCNNLQGSRAEGVWVPTPRPAAPSGATEPASTYVARGMYTLVAGRDCKAVVKAPYLSQDADLVALPAVGGLLQPSEAHPSTPGELYDWMVTHLQLDLAQTAYPQHRVTREEFEAAARARLAVYGGSTYTPPAYLCDAAQSAL